MTDFQLLIRNDVFDKVYAAFCKTVASIEVTAQNFMHFLLTAMQTVELMAKKIMIRGLEKKQLVLNILRKFFENAKNTIVEKFEEIKDKFEQWINGMLLCANQTIDILIAAAKGQLHFNEVYNNLKTVWCAGKPKKIAKNARRDVTDVQALTDQIYNEVKNSIDTKAFDLTNVVTLLTLVMQVIEKQAEITGAEKKQVCISVVNRLVSEIPIDPFLKSQIQMIVGIILDKFIDYVIMAANGELNINEVVQKVKGFFSSCNCCKK